jgi:gas vesicle protein
MARNNEGYGSTTWFIFGALVGVAAGMLLAPKSGREIKEMIGDQTRNWRERANYQAGRLRERASAQAGRFRQRAGQQAKAFRERMNDEEAGR